MIQAVASLSMEGLPFCPAQAVVIKRRADSSEADIILVNIFFIHITFDTADGWLYNVDGRGNRVAAMIYGPGNVIVLCGRNKWVSSLDAAIARNREMAAPANCVRLSKNTPCTFSGKCEDCKSEDRICNEYTLIKRNLPKGRIKVILLNFDSGY